MSPAAPALKTRQTAEERRDQVDDAVAVGAAVLFAGALAALLVPRVTAPRTVPTVDTVPVPTAA